MFEMPDLSVNTDVYPIALILACDTRQETGEEFEKLAAGGNVTQPLHYFFAGTMGNMEDKFGFCWGSVQRTNVRDSQC